MQTKPKANSVITSRLAPEGQAIIFTVQGEGELTLDLTRVAQANRRRAETHGWVQRISDAAALPFNKAEGRYATPAEKMEAMRALVEHYHEGGADWARRAAGGGAPKAPKVTSEDLLILRAVAEVQGVEVSVMRERVREMAEKRGVTQRAYLGAILAKSAEVRAIVERMRAEQPAAAAGLDGDALLADLAGGRNE